MAAILHHIAKLRRPRSPEDSWDGCGRVGDLWPATETGFALAEGAQLDLPVVLLISDMAMQWKETHVAMNGSPALLGSATVHGGPQQLPCQGCRALLVGRSPFGKG
jgi:hypothetical protein